MNIWDSVHRGLEKASHEAGRIARVQRLRATIDTLNRQIYTQQGTLIARAMETFREGHMTQSELMLICQELASLQQQLDQAQSELKQPQNQGPAITPITGPTNETVVNTQPPPMYQNYTEQAPPPPPDYQFYANPTIPVPPPPPPASESIDTGAMQTKATDKETLTASTEQHTCPQCGSMAPASQAYCQNCGTLLENREDAHLPTVRASSNEEINPAETGREEANEKDGGQ